MLARLLEAIERKGELDQVYVKILNLTCILCITFDRNDHTLCFLHVYAVYIYDCADAMCCTESDGLPLTVTLFGL